MVSNPMVGYFHFLTNLFGVPYGGLLHNWLLSSAVHGIYIMQTKISILIPMNNLLCHNGTYSKNDKSF